MPCAVAQTPIQRTYLYRIPTFTPVATLQVQVSVDSDLWNAGEKHEVSFNAQITDVSDALQDGFFYISGIGLYITPLDNSSQFDVSQKVGNVYGPLLQEPLQITVPFTYTFDMISPSQGLASDQVHSKLYFYINYVSSGSIQQNVRGGNYSSKWNSSEFPPVTNQGQEIFLTVARPDPFTPANATAVIIVVAAIFGILSYLEAKRNFLRKMVRWVFERIRNPPNMGQAEFSKGLRFHGVG